MLEGADFGVNIGQLACRPFSDIVTTHGRVYAQSEEFRNFLEREAQRLRTPNELEVSEVVLRVLAVPRSSPRGLREKSSAFVIPHRLDVHLCVFRQLANREMGHGAHLCSEYTPCT
jgi:hypothetical protein